MGFTVSTSSKQVPRPSLKLKIKSPGEFLVWFGLVELWLGLDSRPGFLPLNGCRYVLTLFDWHYGEKKWRENITGAKWRTGSSASWLETVEMGRHATLQPLLLLLLLLLPAAPGAPGEEDYDDDEHDDGDEGVARATATTTWWASRSTPWPGTPWSWWPASRPGLVRPGQ